MEKKDASLIQQLDLFGIEPAIHFEDRGFFRLCRFGVVVVLGGEGGAIEGYWHKRATNVGLTTAKPRRMLFLVLL